MALGTMATKSMPIVAFRIFYSTSYTILLLFLVFLLAITPADQIGQSLMIRNFANLFVIGLVYFVTACIALFIYASRLYTNRVVLEAIPKPYLPIEPGEVSKDVRSMIVRNRHRCALIAWDSRPRDLRPELSQNEQKPLHRTDRSHGTFGRQTKRKLSKRIASTIPTDPVNPSWGQVVHPGWTAPDCQDLPDLQFDAVTVELPNLIEAKAVSMSPPDPSFDFLASAEADLDRPLDPRVVALVQRPSSMSMREYMGHLQKLGMVNEEQNVVDNFLRQYEYARFSTTLLFEDQFRDLLELFSTIMSSIGPMDSDMMAEVEANDGSSTSSSIVPRRSSPLEGRKSGLARHVSTASPAASMSSVIVHSFASSPEPG